jgi:hypothetical protein
MANNDGWSRRFDDPIVLDDGTQLTTLREAIQYLTKTVPKAEQQHKTVLTAADHLTRSGTKLSHDLRPHGDTTSDPPAS